jgi:hypothetical protein
MGSKDYYALLGISPDAEPQEIRKAYIRISRVVHPDRFNPDKQPEDWKQANRMLQEINEAWQILRDPEKRRIYDLSRGYASAGFSKSGGFTYSSKPPEPRPRPSGPDPRKELSPGISAYSELPEHVQKQLMQRQRGEEEDQYYVITDHPTSHFLRAGLLLLWIAVIAFSSMGREWSTLTATLLFIVNAGAFLYAARHISWLTGWFSSPIESRLYITPVYIIETHHGLVRWWPVTGIHDIRITGGNGFLSGAETFLNLQYEEHLVRLKVSAIQLARNCVHMLQEYRSIADQQVEQANYDYIRSHNDFKNVESVRPEPSHATRYGIYGGFLITGLLLYGLLYTSNLGNEPQIGSRLISQMLPQNGSRVIYFDEDDAVAPLELRTSQNRHYLVKISDADTRLPVMTVFLRSNRQLHLRMPDGTFTVRYASGYSWYGPDDYFGRHSEFFADTKSYTFSSRNGELSGHFILLGDPDRIASGELVSITAEQF